MAQVGSDRAGRRGRAAQRALRVLAEVSELSFEHEQARARGELGRATPDSLFRQLHVYAPA